MKIHIIGIAVGQDYPCDSEFILNAHRFSPSQRRTVFFFFMKV